MKVWNRPKFRIIWFIGNNVYVVQKKIFFWFNIGKFYTHSEAKSFLEKSAGQQKDKVVINYNKWGYKIYD